MTGKRRDGETSSIRTLHPSATLLHSSSKCETRPPDTDPLFFFANSYIIRSLGRRRPDMTSAVDWALKPIIYYLPWGDRGGSSGRASDSRFYNVNDTELEPREEAQGKRNEVFRVKKVVLTRCRCAQPVCIRTHKNDHVCTLKIL